MPLDDVAILVAVVGARILIPLLIPRVPLIILVALVLDAVDQTIFQLWTEIDTGETSVYQSYDKALDIYYLAIAYVATMRNWRSNPAFRIAQFLFIYRLVGVTLFELTGERWLLLVFPNTFEYFFIAYELLRTREPSSYSARYWALWAAGIWVFIKLPQEWWIHVAQLDFTDTVRDHPWFGIACAVGIIALVVVYLAVIRPRRRPADYPFRLAADPLPPDEELAAQRRARLLRSGRIFTLPLLEKVVVVTLITVIFSQFLPDVDATPLQIAIGVTALVVADTALSLWAVRHDVAPVLSTARAFAWFMVINTGLALLFAWLVVDTGEDFSPGALLFFVYLLTLIVVLYDRFRPVYEGRMAAPDGTPPGVRDVWSDIRTGARPA